MQTKIIYEDKQVFVCEKPPGFPVQTKNIGRPDCVSELKNYIFSGTAKEPYVGIIHRLDQPVHGLMVFGGSRKAAADLSRQVTEHILGKHYLAVVCGQACSMQGTLVNYMVSDKKSNTSYIAKEGDRDAKKATLHYRQIAYANNLALVEIELVTGRHHQIRVQFANAGMPLWGDSKYNPSFADGKESIALCAYKLEFIHPVSKQNMVFQIVPQNKIFKNFISEAPDIFLHE